MLKNIILAFATMLALLMTVNLDMANEMCRVDWTPRWGSTGPRLSEGQKGIFDVSRLVCKTGKMEVIGGKQGFPNSRGCHCIGAMGPVGEQLTAASGSPTTDAAPVSVRKH
jgi:hypothetical protein